jgi:aspartyl-tRNA(Asn)/glutamyl-tRNA(Gln) amidotransferase subunit A
MSLPEVPPPPTLTEFSNAFRRGEARSIDAVERCLANIADPASEGSRVHTRVWPASARAVAAAMDVLQAHGHVPSVLAGVPISIKDLFDVEGEVTQAGSPALDDQPPASSDAPVVERLKRAGAVLVGRTNMPQFAYSLVGLNSHHGTPGNPWDRRRIPGGSSSGAAVSVADGMAMASIGSDTAGSIRVPAALCGVVGFKPTQDRVPLAGSTPLAPSFDTIGPLARSVQDCARVFGILSGEGDRALTPVRLAGLRAGVPASLFAAGLDAQVAPAFERATSRLKEAGVCIEAHDPPALESVLAQRGHALIQFAEAFAWHRELVHRRGADYDPRIRARILAGRDISAADYLAATALRPRLQRQFDAESAGLDILLLPTVPVVAPLLRDCEDNEDTVRTQLLRSTVPFNYLDLCAISIPIHRPGHAPVGLQLVGRRGQDWHLLSIAHAIEALVSQP